MWRRAGSRWGHPFDGPLERGVRAEPDVAPLYDEVAAEFVELYKKTKAIHRHLNQRRLGSGSH